MRYYKVDFTTTRKASRPDVPQPLSTTMLSGAPWWRNQNDTIYHQPLQQTDRRTGSRTELDIFQASTYLEDVCCLHCDCFLYMNIDL